MHFTTQTRNLLQICIIHMKRIHVSLLFFVTLSVLVFSSCHKSNKYNYSERYLLLGTWTLVDAGIDYNGNVEIDADEVYPHDDNRATVTLEADGTGSSKIHFGYFDLTAGFNWEYDEASKMLTMSKDDHAAHMKVIHVDNKSMVLLNTTITIYGNYTWQVFEKN